MNFSELAQKRQSCRKFDKDKNVPDEEINKIISSAVLAPSACNSQPYHITIAKGNTAKKVAKATMGMGMNKFTENAPIMLIISEKSYNRTAALGSKLKHNDYRSIDIGILSAYITAQAADSGLATCILGWFDEAVIKQICKIDTTIRLVIALGYACSDDELRTKKRKSVNELVTFIND